METEISKQGKKQLISLLVFPLLVIPFVTLAFWAAGGGKGASGQVTPEMAGFNAELPAVPQEQEKVTDKLSFYEWAKRDSLKRAELAKQDPYYVDQDEIERLQAYDPAFNPYAAPGDDSGLRGGYADPNERMVYDKLDQLNAVLENSQDPEPIAAVMPPESSGEIDGLRGDISRLEEMMQMMQGGEGSADPEMDQINSVLESVLDIQHPERVQERLKQQSQENLGQVFAVSTTEKQTPITLLDNKPVAEYSRSFSENPEKRQNRFFGLGDAMINADAPNAIAAVVHETQTLVSGSTVKLRLLDDVFINGTLIPKDNFVYGTASLLGERLEVAVETIRHGHSLFPVKLAVHDMDGLAGIHIPGAITRDVAKQSGDQALQGMDIGTLSPSLGAQAASAGIELGKNLLSKKIKLIKVELKAGYRVLLKDGKRRDY